MARFAINIISFNRPMYLAQVLASLRWNDLHDCDVHLFQDGPQNKFTRKFKCEPQVTLQCCDLFNLVFPKGELHASIHNVGIALQYDRAERYCFEKRDYEAAIFIEDDFVPGPDYIHILKILHMQTKQRRTIGMVSAYGNDRFTPIEEQVQGEYTLVPSIPNWGFLIDKQRWLERQGHYQSYLDLVQGIDYSQRSDNLLIPWIRERGFDVNSTSQDTAHCIAHNMAEHIRLMTVTRNAVYIGAEGEHFSSAEYEAGYYGKDPTWKYKDGLMYFNIPGDEQIDKWITEIRASRWT